MRSIRWILLGISVMLFGLCMMPQEPPVKPSEVATILGRSETQLRATSGIVTTAHAFDGKKNIVFIWLCSSELLLSCNI